MILYTNCLLIFEDCVMKLTVTNTLRQMSTENGEVNLIMYSGLLYLYNHDRQDIIKNIRMLMNEQYNKFKPSLFAEWLKDPAALIRRYDKIFNAKTLKHEYIEQKYEEDKMSYSLGEIDENPDA